MVNHSMCMPMAKPIRMIASTGRPMKLRLMPSTRSRPCTGQGVKAMGWWPALRAAAHADTKRSWSR